MIKKLSSDDLREMIARKLRRDVEEVQETSRDDGFMSTWFDAGHDSCPLFVPIVDFLCGFYDVGPESVELFWNAYDWTYRAEVTLLDD